MWRPQLILCGSRHLIIWRLPHNLSGGRLLIKWWPPHKWIGWSMNILPGGHHIIMRRLLDNLSGGHQIKKWRLPLKLSGGRHIKYSHSILPHGTNGLPYILKYSGQDPQRLTCKKVPSPSSIREMSTLKLFKWLLPESPLHRLTLYCMRVNYRSRG